MGGGVGISIFAPFRIATEKTIFAMPEGRIGFFTDAGSSYFFSRLKKNLGMFLSLTGKRLTGQETVLAGLSDYLIKSCDIE